MSLYRTDTKILSIRDYNSFIDVEAKKFEAQWVKDPSKFKYHITLQVACGTINECPAGIFVNLLFTNKSGAIIAYKKMEQMFEPINGDWQLLLSVIDKHKIQKHVATKPNSSLEVEI